MAELQSMYPEARIHEMISLIFHEHNMSVSQRVMCQYFATYKPHLVRQCKANCPQWHCFWAAGVKNIWTIDQHNKWIHFGLALHTGVEPFSGHILWIKIWHSNPNLQLILSYYLETVEKFGVIPMVTQSDPGTENFEIVWSQFQCQFTPGFEALLEKGMDSGWYDPDNTLQLMTFWWLFIPWLQQEMNNYVHCINNT
ncbi:hypothetical protein J3A83DRAFT_4190273 [Scleroderma citrinum]